MVEKMGAGQLDRAFDEDRKLPDILDKLSRSRLLRLSGSTYDTYNDVFKEYLVYKKLPDFRWSFLYKLGPAAVMRQFARLAELEEFTTEALEVELGIARGSTFNLIRELRNLGLIDRGAAGWFVPEVVTDAYKNVRLGEYVRHQMLKNSVISDLVALLQSRGPMQKQDLPDYLRQKLPFISATPPTWESYSQNVIRWLKVLRLAELVGKDISVPQLDRATLVRDIGNLKQKFRNRGTNVQFLPGAYWRHVEAAFQKVRSGEATILNEKEKDALRDLLDLNVCRIENASTVCSGGDLKEQVKRQMQNAPYKDFWHAVQYGEDLGTC